MLEHKGTVKLETERIILRRWELGDAQDLFDYAKDPDVTTYVGFEPHASVEVSQKLLEDGWVNYEDIAKYKWAMMDKESGRVIGDISLVKVNDRHRFCEFGFSMKKEFWGKGIMTEVTARIIEFLFEEIGMHRIEIRCAPENIGSRRVIEKNGLAYEGHLRECYFTHGKFLDSLVFGILKPDYDKQKNKK